MTYRPYPNVDRARRQVARSQAVNRYGRAPVRYVIGIDQNIGDILAMTEDEVGAMRECLRPMGERLARLRVSTRRAAEQGFGFTQGEYRLSTRPRVVSGGE